MRLGVYHRASSLGGVRELAPRRHPAQHEVAGGLVERLALQRQQRTALASHDPDTQPWRGFIGTSYSKSIVQTLGEGEEGPANVCSGPSTR